MPIFVNKNIEFWMVFAMQVQLKKRRVWKWLRRQRDERRRWWPESSPSISISAFMAGNILSHFFVMFCYSMHFAYSGFIICMNIFTCIVWLDSYWSVSWYLLEFIVIWFWVCERRCLFFEISNDLLHTYAGLICWNLCKSCHIWYPCRKKEVERYCCVGQQRSRKKKDVKVILVENWGFMVTVTCRNGVRDGQL